MSAREQLDRVLTRAAGLAAAQTPPSDAEWGSLAVEAVEVLREVRDLARCGQHVHVEEAREAVLMVDDPEAPASVLLVCPWCWTPGGSLTQIARAERWSTQTAEIDESGSPVMATVEHILADSLVSGQVCNVCGHPVALPPGVRSMWGG